MYPDDDNYELEPTSYDDYGYYEPEPQASGGGGGGGFFAGLAGLGTAAAQVYQGFQSAPRPAAAVAAPAPAGSMPAMNLWVIVGLAVAGVLALVLLLRGKE